MGYRVEEQRISSGDTRIDDKRDSHLRIAGTHEIRLHGTDLQALAIHRVRTQDRAPEVVEELKLEDTAIVAREIGLCGVVAFAVHIEIVVAFTADGDRTRTGFVFRLLDCNGRQDRVLHGHIHPYGGVATILVLLETHETARRGMLVAVSVDAKWHLGAYGGVGQIGLAYGIDFQVQYNHAVATRHTLQRVVVQLLLSGIPFAEHHITAIADCGVYRLFGVADLRQGDIDRGAVVARALGDGRYQGDRVCTSLLREHIHGVADGTHLPRAKIPFVFFAQLVVVMHRITVEDGHNMAFVVETHLVLAIRRLITIGKLGYRETRPQRGIQVEVALFVLQEYQSATVGGSIRWVYREFLGIGYELAILVIPLVAESGRSLNRHRCIITATGAV